MDHDPAGVPGAMRERVPLAELTTLGLGGPARFLVEARDDVAVAEALGWAQRQGLASAVIGGGSNLVIADQGFDGVVVRLASGGWEVRRQGDRADVVAAAGQPWDELVGELVSAGLAGLECLSGIPGTVGATPIQNVGAYGQEVADSIVEVRVLDRRELVQRSLARSECGFGYRTSRFRTEPERFAVLAVTFRLRVGGEPELRYRELAAALAARRARPTLEEVRAAVLELRRSKSMVLEHDDPNRCSVGSFFVNPTLEPAEADRIARELGNPGLPRFRTPQGLVRIPAAWLIERCGFVRGLRRGAVGISSRHSLALVHHGGGRTAELVAFAREIRSAVRDRFGIDLRPEPTFLGFSGPDPTADPCAT